MCTGLRFTDINGNLFYGRNLDVESSYGEQVLVTPRNYPLPYKFLDNKKTTKALIGMGIMLVITQCTSMHVMKMVWELPV